MTLLEHLKAFLAFLQYNRNVSPHTLRAYDTDLRSSCVDSLAERDGCKPSEVAVAPVRHATASATFLAALHDRGNSRASAARRLAALRTFARYLVREDLLADDPTALVGAPRREQTLPAHLGGDEMDRLLGRARRGDAGRPPRSRDPRAVLRVGPAPERTRRSRPRGRQPLEPGGAGARQGRARSGSCRSTARRPRRSAR